MYNYSFNSKRKEEIYQTTGTIFADNISEANIILDKIINYEVDFFKRLSNNCHAKCDVIILDKKLEEITRESFKFTKEVRRNKELEREINMTDEEKREIEELINQFE